MTATPAPAHDCLTSALAAAQADFGVIGKDRSVNAGPKKYAYADLAAVLAVVRPALARHGIAITQRTRMAGETLCLVSELRFKAEVIDCEMPLLVDARNPQALGSYLSYARRYSLLALTGVQPEDEDDDGQAAKDAPAAARQQHRPQADAATRQHVDAPTRQPAPAGQQTSGNGAPKPSADGRGWSVVLPGEDPLGPFATPRDAIAVLFRAMRGEPGADGMNAGEIQEAKDINRAVYDAAPAEARHAIDELLVQRSPRAA